MDKMSKSTSARIVREGEKKTGGNKKKEKRQQKKIKTLIMNYFKILSGKEVISSYKCQLKAVTGSNSTERTT